MPNLLRINGTTVTRRNEGMTKFTNREGRCGNVCMSLDYKMVDRPVENRVASTVYFNRSLRSRNGINSELKAYTDPFSGSNHKNLLGIIT